MEKLTSPVYTRLVKITKEFSEQFDLLLPYLFQLFSAIPVVKTTTADSKEIPFAVNRLFTILCVICLIGIGNYSVAQVVPNSVSVSTYSGAVGSVSVTMPTGSNVEDVVFVVIATDDDGAISEPSEFTQVYEFWHNGDGPTLGIFYRVIDGTEADAYNFTFLSEPAVVTTLRYADLDPANPIDAMGMSTGLNNAPTSPSVTTTKDNLTYLHLVAVDQRNADASNGPLIVNSATADTIMLDQSAEGWGHVETGIFSQVLATAGATAAGSFSWGNSQSWSAATLALNSEFVKVTSFTGGDCNGVAATIVADYEASSATGMFEVLDPSGTVVATEPFASMAGSVTVNFNTTTDGDYVLRIQAEPSRSDKASFYPNGPDTDSDGVCDIVDLDDDNDGIVDTLENKFCDIDYNTLAGKQFVKVSATANTSGNIQVLLDGNTANNNFFYQDVSIVDKEVIRIGFAKPTILSGIEFAIGNSYMFNTGARTIMQASNNGMTWTDVSTEYTMVRPPNNTPGILSSAPYAQTFLWTNTTPFLYYRLYGVFGNTNQNPWINELFFQTDYFCDFDNDGLANNVDLDSDNDGIPDNVEGQPTLAYVAPSADTPLQYTMQNGINSAYGTGLPSINTDGDLCDDFIDEDSDGDGVLDQSESGLTFNNVIGSNGLDSGSETVDDYTDVNGIIDDPKTNLFSLDPGVSEVTYRQAPSPGGVFVGLNTWLKSENDVYSDLGNVPANNNDAIGQWNTQINSDHAIQGTATKQPVYKEGSQIEGINYNSAVWFDGSNDELNFPSNLGVANTNEFTIFAVAKTQSNGVKRIFGPASSAGGAYEMDVTRTTTVRAGIVNIAVSPTVVASGQSHIAMTSRAGNLFSASTNGESPATGTNTVNFTSGNNYDLGSSYNANPDFHGSIGEFVVYNEAIDSSSIVKVNSYLAIKYGITLLHDYVSSSGSTIWSMGEGYDSNIAGIGLDLASGLNQKQSIATLDTTITLGLTSIFSSNQANSSSFDSNSSFLLWGSNNLTDSINVDINPLLSRMKRVWKVANTNNVGSVVAQVHNSLLEEADLVPVIIVSADEIFDENDTVIELNQDGEYYKGPIELPDKSFFTIGAKAPQPLIISIRYSKN